MGKRVGQTSRLGQRGGGRGARAHRSLLSQPYRLPALHALVQSENSCQMERKRRLSIDSETPSADDPHDLFARPGFADLKPIDLSDVAAIDELFGVHNFRRRGESSQNMTPAEGRGHYWPHERALTNGERSGRWPDDAVSSRTTGELSFEHSTLSYGNAEGRVCRRAVDQEIERAWASTVVTAIAQAVSNETGCCSRQSVSMGSRVAACTLAGNPKHLLTSACAFSAYNSARDARRLQRNKQLICLPTRVLSQLSLYRTRCSSRCSLA